MKTVALSMRLIRDPKGFWYDAIEENWSPYLYAQGIQPIFVPNDPKYCAQYLNDVEALVLTGGDTSHIANGQGDPTLKRRDATEHILVTEAQKKELRILGICRGMEFLNVYFGGTLKKIAHPCGVDHDVDIADVTIQSLFSKGPIRVNSFHDWGVDILGDDLISFATAADGAVEGFVHKTEKIMGVIWHPERTFADPKSQKIHKNIIRKFLALTPLS